jgi:predicted enzyme related to lactoylglutathione lyase
MLVGNGCKETEVTTARVCCVPGAPCWVSLMARDLDVAMAFYGPLLGWTFEPGPDRWGPYVRAVVEGTEVAGIGAIARNWETSVAWTTYFGVESADAIAADIRDRGATVAVGPLEFDAGRLAIAADPQGASFGIWEGVPGPPRKLRIPGAPAWIELRTRDAFASAMFYGEIFAWDRRDPNRYVVEWENDRVVLYVDGHPVAGLRGGGVEAAADPRVRPRWHVFFAVPDIDEAVQHAKELGGEITGEPMDSAYGRVAGLRDPEGGLLSLISDYP